MEESAGSGGLDAMARKTFGSRILCVPNGVSQCLVEFGDV